MDMAGAGTHIMRVSLHDEPAIHRAIEIASTKSLYAFAEAIVAAFDFNFDHAFGFYSGRTEKTLMSAQPQYELFADIGEESNAKSVKKTKMAEAFPSQGHRLLFLFDYGDEWLFDVETIRIDEQKPKSRYPRTLMTAGPSPVQYPDPDEDD
jgi:hypothetical protein